MLYQAYQAQVGSHGARPALARRLRRTAIGHPAAGHAGVMASVRNLTAAYELIARARPDPQAPGLRHRQRHGRQPRGRGPRRGGARHAVRHAAAFQEGRRQSRSRGCCWSRRCPATSPRCCAAPCAPCCPSMTSTSPTGTTCATCRLGRPLRLRRLHRAPDQLSRGDGRGRPCARGVPALRRGAGAAAVMAQGNHPASRAA